MKLSYAGVAQYDFALYSHSGEQVASDLAVVGPLGVKILDIRAVIPAEQVERERDYQAGLSAFTLIGYSDYDALAFLVVNAAPSIEDVAVEHTHPPQTYIFPFYCSEQRVIKTSSIAVWSSILHGKRIVS